MTGPALVKIGTSAFIDANSVIGLDWPNDRPRITLIGNVEYFAPFYDIEHQGPFFVTEVEEQRSICMERLARAIAAATKEGTVNRP